MKHWYLWYAAEGVAECVGKRTARGSGFRASINARASSELELGCDYTDVTYLCGGLDARTVEVHPWFE